MNSDSIRRIDVVRLRVSRRTTFVFIELQTLQGVPGLGEASMSSDDVATIGIARRLFDDILKGEDVAHIPTLINRLHDTAGPAPARYTATAISALEQALCDIRARTLNVSLAELLGGRLRTHVPLYANVNRGLRDRSPAGFGDRAREAVSAGFTVLKCAPFDGISPSDWQRGEYEHLRDIGVERVAAVREAIGTADVMVDCHGRFGIQAVSDIAERLEPYGLRWLEEPVATRSDFHAFAEIPVTSDNSDVRVLPAVRARCPFRLAGGEFPFGVKQFRELFELRALDVAMPDVKHCGGISELVRIAGVADSYGVAIAPHNPSGPVSTLASAHAASALRNFEILEYQWGDVPSRAELLIPAERIEHGKLVLPEGPGIGAGLNRAFVDEHRIELDDADVA